MFILPPWTWHLKHGNFCDLASLLENAGKGHVSSYQSIATQPPWNECNVAYVSSYHLSLRESTSCDLDPKKNFQPSQKTTGVFAPCKLDCLGTPILRGISNNAWAHRQKRTSENPCCPTETKSFNWDFFTGCITVCWIRVGFVGTFAFGGFWYVRHNLLMVENVLKCTYPNSFSRLVGYVTVVPWMGGWPVITHYTESLGRWIPEIRPLWQHLGETLENGTGADFLCW